jgi:hypothetical protein
LLLNLTHSLPDLLLPFSLFSSVLQVWYGVPARAADAFEDAMRDALPHLFEEVREGRGMGGGKRVRQGLSLDHESRNLARH